MNEIEIGGRSERLPPKFIDVLVALAERPLEVCAKSVLLQRVWGDPLTGDEALTHAIWVLRRSLGDDAKRPRFIQTVPRRGYRLLLAPEACSDLPSAPGIGGESPRTVEPVTELSVTVEEPATNTTTGSGGPQKRAGRIWAALGVAAMVSMLLLVAVSRRTPAPPLAFDAGDRLTGMSLLDAGPVLLSRRDGELMAVNPLDARVLWRTRLGAPAAAAPLVVDDLVLLGSDDGYLYALEQDSGRERWRIDSEADLRATPSLLDGWLELGNDQGNLLQFDVSSGKPRWRRSVEGRIRGRILAFTDQSVHTTLDGRVRALQRADGEVLWERSLEAGISALQSLGDERVVFSVESGAVIALDVANGREAWRVDLVAAAGAPAVRNGRVFAIGRQGDAVLIRAVDGQPVWRSRLPVAGAQQPIWWYDSIVIALDRRSLGLVDPNLGVLHRRLQLPSPPDHVLAIENGPLLVATLDGRLWSVADELRSADEDLQVGLDGDWQPLRTDSAAGDPIEALAEGPLPTALPSLASVGPAQDLAFDEQGRLYVADSAGITALDADAQLRWRAALPVPPGTQPVLVGDVLLLGGNDGQLYALSAEDGRERWRFATADKVRSAPRVRDGRVFFGGVDGVVRALDLASGALLWSYQCDKAVHPAPALDAHAVYVGSGDAHVHALDAESGQLLWKAAMDDWVVAEPALAHGNLYVGVADGSLRALDPADGSERWRFLSGGRIWFAVRAAGDHVYFASGDGYVYAVDALSGRERWRQRVGTQAEGRIEIHRGVVYAGSPDAFLYALDAETGKPLWRLSTGGAVLNPSVWRNLLMVGSTDQRIHRLQLAEPDS